VRELTGGTEEFAFDGEREVELKGLSGLQRVFGVEWRGSDPAHVSARGSGAAPTPSGRVLSLPRGGSPSIRPASVV